MRSGQIALCCVAAFFSLSSLASAEMIFGVVKDQTGAMLPGVAVELRGQGAAPSRTVTNAAGEYSFDGLEPGTYWLSFILVNFAPISRRDIALAAAGAVRIDVALYLTLSADVTVSGKRIFTNLADAERPAEDLVGIAQSASQGAVIAHQLDIRPLMRAGEVLETVPGLVTSQHSGEGKANQYYLRGFNLDHGTDLATTVAGLPVNMPTHAHGQGYSDLNFLIPELVSGVQYSKGPYFADQGDFATAGAASISYVNQLERPIIRVGAGDEGYERALAAGSMRAGKGSVLAAFEANNNDGPWENPDEYRKINGLVRYSRGDMTNGFAITGMGYRAKWNSTDQIPQRAVADGLVGRFGALDPSDGGNTYRYSGSVEWQRSHGNGATKVMAYGLGYDLSLFSNFTFFLDNPERGDQFQQADHRFVTGGKVSHTRAGRLAGREMRNTFGVQTRTDSVTVGLFHTEARQVFEAVREDQVFQASGALYAQNEIAWTPWLRTLAGIRGDSYRFNVEANDPRNSGTRWAGIVSPKGGAVFGPWKGTELYLNAGAGFHSNDARGTTMTVVPGTNDPAVPVTPLVRAKGVEGGFRTVAIPQLQTTFTAWALNLDSELLFVGDAGTTQASRPSHRYGIEWTNYYSPRRWVTFDADLAWSRSHFTDFDQAGNQIPGSIETVASAGATVDNIRNIFGTVRLRYFGPRPLIEDGSVRSKATTLVNLDAGYKLTRSVRVALDVFNLLDAKDSDIDYYYASRLPGEEPAGLTDLHFHPALPRTARVLMIVGF
jgi:outer membrane receptor protein involved in Fe transport